MREKHVEMIITRRIKAGEYCYQSNSAPQYTVIANHTWGLARRRLTAYQDKRAIYALKQTNLVAKVLLIPLAPVLPSRTLPVYKLYDRNVQVGRTRACPFSPRKELKWDDVIYEFYLHSDNYISIMKGGVQVALLQKDAVTIGEQNRYSVVFDAELEASILKILLFTAFIDIIYYPNRLKASYWKYEKTVGKEKLPERLEWKPNPNKRRY